MILTQADVMRDLPVIRALWHGYREYLHEIDYYEFGGETVDPELADLAAHYPPETSGIYLLAPQADHPPVATVSLKPLNAIGVEVRRLYVLPDMQGRGYGRSLMQHAEINARQLGYGTLYCDTFRTIPGPQALYKSLGFQPCPAYNAYSEEKLLFFKKQLR